MKKEIKRPKILDEYMAAKAAENKAVNYRKQIGAECKKVLRLVPPKQFNVRLIVKRPLTVDLDLALDWAETCLKKKYITKEEFEGLFVNVMNKDAVITLVRELIKRKKKSSASRRAYNRLPKGVIKKGRTEEVRIINSGKAK